MKKSARRMAVLGAVGVILVSCGGSSSDSSEISISSSTSVAASTTSSVAPTTTSTTSTSTTTTIPEPVDVPLAEIVELENLTFHIDQAALDLVATQDVVNAVNDILQTYPLTTPAHAILIATNEESLRWAQDKSREIDCMYEPDIKRYTQYVGGADVVSGCGFIMRVDVLQDRCGSLVTTCRTTATVGLHEFFHVITAQIVKPCSCRGPAGNKFPIWYNEGAADYVSFVSLFGRSDKAIHSLIQMSTNQARTPDVDVDLVEIEKLWAEGPGRFPFLYERSFLAILLLIEQYGEQAVLSDYYYAIVLTGNYEDAFELTFGKTIEEFSEEFDVWLDSL
jgi:hypothetical protein